MNIISITPDSKININSVLAIGNFDGLHLGHQLLIKKVLEKSKLLSAVPSVLTFYPHPSMVIGNRKIVEINTFTRKIKLLSSLGINNIYLVRFNNNIRMMSSKEFIEVFLIKTLSIMHLFVGANFYFGHDKLGNAALLQKCLDGYNVTTDIVPLLSTNSLICSSSKIRELLLQGKVKLANSLLGYCYHITDVVLHGKKRGRLIGYPTINMHIKNTIAPKIGVYKAQVTLQNDPLKKYNAIVNLGIRPTFDNDNTLIMETHIINNFSAELYGSHCTVYLLDFIREERKFDGVDSLKRQIAKDIKAAW